MLRCSSRVWHGFLTTFCLLIFVTSPVLATHLVDHRFTVYGTVRDGTSFPGTPLAGKEVVVRFQESGKELQRGTTDAKGHFSLLLHVHNEDAGKQIIVRSQGVEKSVALQFDPNDTTIERQVRVELVVVPR